MLVSDTLMAYRKMLKKADTKNLVYNEKTNPFKTQDDFNKFVLGAALSHFSVGDLIKLLNVSSTAAVFIYDYLIKQTIEAHKGYDPSKEQCIKVPEAKQPPVLKRPTLYLVGKGNK